MLSSGSIIPLSFQAGELDDTSAATAACMVIPWMYSTGWILQYGSLSAKSYRLYKMVASAHQARRVKVTALDMFKIVIAGLCVNWVIVLLWTILDPFHWERIETGLNIDQELGLVRAESFGNCRSDNIWDYVAPL